MCGINGFNWKDEAGLKLMNETIKHRGPDFSGSFFNEEVSLGHLLLSIRENTEISKQPFKDGKKWILLFNGQIYNTSQLKKELPGIDRTKEDLDTYILYKTIEKYGWDFIYKIHGMYAIALYNTEKNELRLYRDPSGQKNIYYYSKNDLFVFSSEIKGIITHKNIDKEVSLDGLNLATSLGYIPGQHTIFKYIYKVEPSQMISFKLKTRKLNKSFFKSTAEDYFPENWNDAFHQLVSEHLQSKQKIAINLSGGLDSSILLHEAVNQGCSIKSYSTKFLGGNEKYNNDAELAKKLASDYGVEHNEILITKKSYLENLRESYEALEEPNFNISLPAYLITAKKEGRLGDNNRVIISGNGGDEIFAGYPHYFTSQRMSNQIKILTPWIFNLLKNYRNHTNFNYNDIDERWMSFRLFYKNFLHKEQEIEKIIHLVKEADENLISLYQNKKGVVYETMLRDRFLWMPAENFTQTDKLYMHESIELRSPLSFHPFRIYCDKKLKEKDYIKEGTNKRFLRNLYKNKLPDYIIERKEKTGWRSPLLDWYDDSFKKEFLEILPMSNGPFLDWKSVRREAEKSERWPGKQIHLYISLAIIKKVFNIDI